MTNLYTFGKYRQWLMLWMYFQKIKCLFAIGITLPGHSKVILAGPTPFRWQLCSIGRRSASRSLLYEYAAWDSNWCPHECKSHWGHSLKLLFCYLWIYYYYYYCVFLYSCVLGCFWGFKQPECGSEHSLQSNVKIYSNFLLAFPHRWVNLNTTTVVPLQSGSPSGLAILGPNILQYFRLKLFWQCFIIVVVVIIATRSVGTPRTRWEDIVQRVASHILGIQGWRRWVGIERNGGISWGRLGATRGCSALRGWIEFIIIIKCCWVQYFRLKEF